MSGFTMNFECDNAAFWDSNDGKEFSYEEVSKVIHRVAKKVSDGYIEGPIHDTNGNRIGSWTLEVDEPDGDEDEGED